MAIDWSSFDKELDAAIERGAAKTDAKLAAQVSSLTRLTDAEVKQLFPEPADVERLATLLKIVKSAESRNVRMKRIASNIDDLAGTLLTLVEKFA